MNYWVLADTHFGHEKMKDYCQRPDGFEDKILSAVARLVQCDDVLIHIGDFCIYCDEYWHELFRSACLGKRWLVRGNHDRKSLGWYFSHGWDFVADEFSLEVFGKRVLFSHAPVPEIADAELNIHGHLHNTGHHPELHISTKHRLVYLEHTYEPLNLRKIIEGA